MLPAAVLLLASFLPASSTDTVLVKDDGADLAPAGTTESVLGWRKVPVDGAPPDLLAVPNAYLDLQDLDGEPLGPDQWALDRLGAPRAWSETTGEPSVVIAVIDSGIELDHPDLADRLYTNPGEIPFNDVDDDGNGLVDDLVGWDIVDDDNDPTDPSVGHGTEVAGVASASLNGVGIAGVAPTSTLLPIRACSTRCELFDVAWAVTYATDLGADIINLSLGGFADPGPLADAVDYAQAAGVLVVAAAGNGGTDIDGASFVPADLPNPNLMAVAATDQEDWLWDESNFGAETVEVAAPGVGIATTTLSSLGTHRTVTGTSFATPHVAGTAALMLSVNQALSPLDLIEKIGGNGRALGMLQGRTAYGTRLAIDRSTVAALLLDVDGSVFASDIVWLATQEVTKGCNPPDNTLYCPQRALTRGEIAAFLDRALGLAPGPAIFADATDSPFKEHISALAQAGITNGCNPPENTLFCPERPITRGEIAAFLRRALGLDPGPDVFADAVDSPFQTSINALAQAGITKGCNPPDNTLYCPDDPVTRGEIAALLHRALG